MTFIRQALAAYLPDAKVEQLALESLDIPNATVVEFYQTAHYAFPLNSINVQPNFDSLAYLTAALSDPARDETIQLQIVITPAQLKQVGVLQSRLRRNENVLDKLGNTVATSLTQSLTNIIHQLAFWLLDGIHLATTASSPRQPGYNYPLQSNDIQISRGQRPARSLSRHEQQLADELKDKLSQPLFKAAIRLQVAATDPQNKRRRIDAVKSSLGAYGHSTNQSLRARPLVLNQAFKRYQCKKRLPVTAAARTNILSVKELAAFYNLTQSYTHRTDNLDRSLSPSLPAPVSLKQGATLDVILGINHHRTSQTLIGLTQNERERHVYIIGGTGNGKTTMLQYAIVQDIRAGKGVAVVDPHGDLAETLLQYIPAERVKDVIYFNPDDLEYPIGLNLLELSPGLSGKDLLREKDLITESVISIFRKIFSEDDTGGHRIEYVLRNAVQTALTVPNATLFTIYRLLNNSVYRRAVLKKVDNEDLKNFWNHELGKAGDMQKVKMSAGITAKIGRFLFSASAKQILEQPHSTIDFDDIINNSKILICNFSKGLLGEDTSELFGTMVLAKLQLASLRRARLPKGERYPYYLYVDEFQNFATDSFVQMLSESRKYKLHLTMAEQSTSQQKDQRMVNVILANVGTVISFRTGNTHDERLLLPMFQPYIEAGHIANLPAFSFYVKLAAISPQEPLSGVTLLLPKEFACDTYNEIIAHSRIAYAYKNTIAANENVAAVSNLETTSVPIIDR
ncbi:MAG: hypothetical protein NVS1B10_03650 [Candidatus Saccharimonadales bacterium]